MNPGKVQPRPDPLYRKIFLALQAQIQSGEFAHGRYLPSEYDLAKAFDVSRITAIRALNDLAAAGLVVRERGRGTRVRIMSSGTVVRGPQGATIERAPSFASKPKQVRDYVRLMDLRSIPAPRDAAAALMIRPGRNVVYAVRMLTFGGLPYAHIAAYVRPGLGEQWSAEDLERDTLAKLIEMEGVTIVRTSEEVSAVPADPSIARHLQVAPKSPILRILRTSFDENGTPTEYLIAYHPSDRYRYAVTSNLM